MFTAGSYLQILMVLCTLHHLLISLQVFNNFYWNLFVVSPVKYLKKISGNSDMEEPSDIENIRVFNCGRAA
jgi:hypothetical protein